MAKTLSLSIIIPVFNEEDYIGECLDAIASQSMAPDEVIIVDNNSSDKTVEIAKSYSFVKIINEKQQGVLFARNKGLNVAKSDYIARIDADTRLPDEWISKAKDVLSDGNCSAITGPHQYYDFPLGNTLMNTENFFLMGAKLLGYNFLFGSNCIIKRDSWNRVQESCCITKEMFEDVDLAFHISQMKNGKVCYSHKIWAGASARRVKDSPIDFYNYLKLHRKTNELHGISKFSAYYSEFWYMVFYLVFRPFYMRFDQNTRKFRLKKINNKPRPHPM